MLSPFFQKMAAQPKLISEKIKVLVGQSDTKSKILNILLDNKETAIFKALYAFDKPTSEYGHWIWTFDEFKIELTCMVRAMMVEIYRNGTDDSYFIWNRALSGYNDVRIGEHFDEALSAIEKNLIVEKEILS